jgi:hypothetical protein
MRRALTKGGKMVFINYVLRKKLVQIIKQKWNGPPLRELIFNVNEVFFVLEKQNFRNIFVTKLPVLYTLLKGLRWTKEGNSR